MQQSHHNTICYNFLGVNVLCLMKIDELNSYQKCVPYVIVMLETVFIPYDLYRNYSQLTFVLGTSIMALMDDVFLYFFLDF